MKTHKIISLLDGENWTTIDGSSICVITEEDFQRLLNKEIKICDIITIAEVRLDSTIPTKQTCHIESNRLDGSRSYHSGYCDRCGENMDKVKKGVWGIPVLEVDILHKKKGEYAYVCNPCAAILEPVKHENNQKEKL